MRFMQQKRTIGTSRRKRRYDVPLNKDAGTGFLILLIALMSFLTVMSLSAAFALSAITERWSSGLENKITIEIPAVDTKGQPVNRQQTKRYAVQIGQWLENYPKVKEFKILQDEEIADLVEPWLKGDLVNSSIPLPSLISVTLHDSKDRDLSVLKKNITEIAPHARVEGHEKWLGDLLRFTGALRFAAVIMLFIIITTLITAVAGAIKSRMAVHKAEVELLHLMGAADRYIARQFQRHSAVLAIKGAVTGLILALVALFLIGWVSGEMDIYLIPNVKLAPVHFMIITSVPVLIAALAFFTAGRTVFQNLQKMP